MNFCASRGAVFHHRGNGSQFGSRLSENAELAINGRTGLWKRVDALQRRHA
jgi:hypothetical protein